MKDRFPCDDVQKTKKPIKNDIIKGIENIEKYYKLKVKKDVKS